MKSMAAVALIVATTALPVCAQRGMARGGSAGPGVFAGHGGVPAPTASRFAAPGRPFAFSAPSTFNRSLPVTPASRPASFNHYPHRPPYLPAYRRRGVFIGTVGPGIYSYYPYLGYPGLFDDSSDSQPYPNNEQAPPPDYGQQTPPPDYGQQAPPPDNGPAPYPYYYSPVPPSTYSPVPPSAQSQSWPSSAPPYLVYSVPIPAPPSEENPVTLIFRNGRAPELIHNYLMTPTTLTVLDQPYQQIPLDQIDIAATVKKNREAGVDFRVPDSSR